MDWMIPGLKAAMEAFKAAYKKGKHELSKREQKKLISNAMTELLQLHPDLDAVDAAIEAAKTTGVKPSAELFRATRMRENVASYKGVKKKVAKKKTVKKKTAAVKRKKAVAKKKSTTKKSSRAKKP